MTRIARHLIIDLLKNRVLLGTLLLFIVAGWGTFYIESQPQKASLVLMQVSLLALPLITMVFGCIYYYNSHEFIELLLSHPIRRRSVIQSFYISLSSAFSLCYLVGVGLPLLIFHPVAESVFLLASGLLLTWTFCGIALCVSTAVHDRVKGMGITLILWAIFAFLYDGLLIYIMYQFGQYPIEDVIMALSFLNPIDIARIAVIMQTDAAAMMGLSGAIFVDFFGSTWGIIASFGSLLVWAVAMYFLALRNFAKRDL